MIEDIQYMYNEAALCAQAGDMQGVVKLLEKIKMLTPNDPKVHFNLGFAYHKQNKINEAERSYGRCLKLDNDYLGAHFNLSQLVKVKKPELAITHLKKILEKQPENAEARQGIGEILYISADVHFNKAQYDEAIIKFKSAMEYIPANGDMLNTLGVAYLNVNRLKEAMNTLLMAVRISPDSSHAYTNLGNVCDKLEMFDEAVKYHTKAISLNSQLSQAHYNLANLLAKNNQLNAAIKEFKLALEDSTACTEVYNNMGNAYALIGMSEEALKCYRLSLESDKSNITAHSNLLFTMMCLESYTPDVIYKEHLKWAHIHARSITPYKWSRNIYKEHYRCHIAYLSPDFRAHSVASFIEPILRLHNKEKFKVYCYSNVKQPDLTTDKMRNYCDSWRDIVNLRDDEAADLIREDEIEILVDLAGHSSGNRLLLMAKKPSPVQFTYLGYPNTTGVEAIDYRITDKWADPSKKYGDLYTEKLVYTPNGFLCYQTPDEAPEIVSSPVNNNGYITFGSFNNLAKVSLSVIKTWSNILNKVPDSRLIMKHLAFEEIETIKMFMKYFHGLGVSEDRVDLLSWSDNRAEHFSVYNKIDIALDTFPYNGTTTSCEALWMGVPIVVLEGNSHVSRVGVSILNNIGLQDFIAKNTNEYVNIACKLSGDPNKLEYIRKNIRGIMRRSRLCDYVQFVSDLEDIYISLRDAH